MLVSTVITDIRKESDTQPTETVVTRSNPTLGNFLASVNTFDANIDNIGNFVLFQFFTNAQHWQRCQCWHQRLYYVKIEKKVLDLESEV